MEGEVPGVERRRIAREERRQKRLKRKEKKQRKAADLERARRESEAKKEAALEEQQNRWKREQRKKRRRESPKTIELPPNNDPLITYDRNGNELTNHPLRNLAGRGAGFLVCGGPSLQDIDLNLLRRRGIFSLGVNNAAAHAPVSAFCCGDPVEKFHHGIFFDPDTLKLVPQPKLGKRVRVSVGNGEFRWSAYRVMDCPNVFGFSRGDQWDPPNFLNMPSATWGCGTDASKRLDKPKILFTFFLGLRLMHYLGLRRVYLLGVDFYMTPEKGYAFEQAIVRPDFSTRIDDEENIPARYRAEYVKHEDGAWYKLSDASRGNNNSYRVAIPMLAELKPHFDAAGFEVYQCNPKSHLTVFPHVAFEEALKDCQGIVPDEPWNTGGHYEKQ